MLLLDKEGFYKESNQALQVNITHTCMIHTYIHIPYLSNVENICRILNSNLLLIITFKQLYKIKKKVYIKSNKEFIMFKQLYVIIFIHLLFNVYKT